MRLRFRPGARSTRQLKRIAVVVGGLFILVGIAALIGDPDQAQGQRRTAVFARALKGLREAFGDPGAGIAMIVVGVALGSLLWWLADRK
ncbi:MAG: hypothetical protein RLN72_03490 [Henriciella sp.]